MTDSEISQEPQVGQHLDGPIRIELEHAVRLNEGQLGAVFSSLESGVTRSVDLAAEGVMANSGAAQNLKVAIRAILDGKLPTAPSLATSTGRRIGSLLRAHESFKPTVVGRERPYPPPRADQRQGKEVNPLVRSH
jgi:hypothetical protein